MLILVLLLGAASCSDTPTPRPAGYLRVDYPEKGYQLYDSLPMLSFEIPVYARLEKDPLQQTEDAAWYNLEVPPLNASVHLSYRAVNDNLATYIADCRKLAYKHSVKADGIEETPFIHREEKRFGMVYDLSGNVASAVQFFITDSTTHFLRGSLYFACTPNRDSLRPVISFLRKDIMHLIETTEWK
jgi:gliding motility-associated lipoprotein GldD